MIPSKHSRSLYFTPRTPWGRYPQNRPGQSQNYLRASEDEHRTDFERAMDKNNVPRSLQSTAPSDVNGKTPSASREDQDGLPLTPWHSPIRQGAMDQFEEQGHDQRAMDDQGVPRSLQGQIIPQRAREVTNPFRKPLTGLTDDVFAPAPPQTSQAATGSKGASTPSAQQQRQTPAPGEADKTWNMKEPEKNWWDNPLKYKGWEFIPGPHQFQLRKNF